MHPFQKYQSCKHKHKANLFLQHFDMKKRSLGSSCRLQDAVQVNCLLPNGHSLNLPCCQPLHLMAVQSLSCELFTKHSTITSTSKSPTQCYTRTQPQSWHLHIYQKSSLDCWCQLSQNFLCSAVLHIIRHVGQEMMVNQFNGINRSTK